MKRPVQWLAALGLVVVASIAVATAPQSGTIADPFVRTGSVGEVVHGRDFDVQVLDVRLASELDLVYDDEQLGTDGAWVIVDLVATANVDTIGFTFVELRIDGVRYRTYDLGHPSMTFIAYGADIPVKGALVFEVPMRALEGPGLDDARVYFQYSLGVQLDDVPEVVVDLRDLPVERSAIIDEPVVIGVD